MSIASRFATHGKKIVAIGRNYAEHIKELNNTTPPEPFFFLKPTTSYVTPEQKQVIEIPRGVDVHHEVELGVVISKLGRDIPVSEAFSFVAGYTLAIDVTARNIQNHVKGKGLPWTTSKGFDSFCPISRFIPRDEVKDPYDLQLWLKVNEEMRQREKTNLMLWKIPELIHHVSGIMTLEEGDLILTGTPAGVGPVKAGDKVFAGLVQDGTELARLDLVAKARLGGYQFTGK
ncbi:hypothetical protein BT69DRAFT_1283252 [Atractiella rhizophila]|nr:hypothetical protein BT69DRAFT_1283252 [Atractiella rhizophila]